MKKCFIPVLARVIRTERVTHKIPYSRQVTPKIDSSPWAWTWAEFPMDAQIMEMETLEYTVTSARSRHFNTREFDELQLAQKVAQPDVQVMRIRSSGTWAKQSPRGELTTVTQRCFKTRADATVIHSSWTDCAFESISAVCDSLMTSASNQSCRLNKSVPDKSKERFLLEFPQRGYYSWGNGLRALMLMIQF